MDMIKTIDVGKEFYHRLANRDRHQCGGQHSAEEFREMYLSILCDKNAWRDDHEAIVLDFKHVKKLGPSFANEAFAYFTQWAKPDCILKKIRFLNISPVKLRIIKIELESGYGRLR